MEVEAAPWDDTAIDWPAFDAIVVRSPHDYHKRETEFRPWLEKLSALHPHSVFVFNEPQTMLWNMDKSYLRELSQKGLPHGVVFPKTLWFRREDAAQNFQLREEMAKSGLGRRAVVKPVVGAGKLAKSCLQFFCNSVVPPPLYLLSS